MQSDVIYSFRNQLLPQLSKRSSMQIDGEDEKDGEDSEGSGEGSEATEGWNNMLMEDEDDGLGMDIDIY